jgi:hypothetical protein
VRARTVKAARSGACVACQAAAQNASALDATIVLLAMLRDGQDPAAIHRELCFTHRRLVESTAQMAATEDEEGSKATVIDP